MAQIEYTFILFTGLMGFLLVYLMLTKFGASKLINGFLIFNICIVSCLFTVHGTYNLHFQNLIADLNAPPLKFIIYLAVPNSYLYVKAIINDQPINFLDILKHLCLPLFLFIFNIICLLNGYELAYLTLCVNLSVTIFMTIFYLYKTFFICYKKLWKKKFSINDEHYQTIKTKRNIYTTILIRNHASLYCISALK